ncbi:MAG: hypothetical protein MUO75_07700, partial [Actinobacteria bacterium]|nr:hypothetical protein [Actinomycetota bacterium]
APHSECVRALEILGIPDNETTASRVSSELMKRSDLAITMTRQQCYQMAHKFPEYKRRCFAIIEINGAIETILESRGTALEDRDWEKLAIGLPDAELSEALDAAASALQGAPRELMRPIPGVPLDVRELMTLFSTCFYQVSGVHDPIGGTEEETERCARQIDTEVTRLLRGMLALALS